MPSTPLYYVWDYRDVDHAFWEEQLEPWLPARLIDAHTHIMDPALRRAPMTEAMRKQYWVNEVFEPIDATTADHCYQVVFPHRQVKCLAFGVPDLDFDLEAGNDYVQRQCPPRGWSSLAVVPPQWPLEKIIASLDKPGVIGVKPYYALMGANRETRDEYLEASIYDFVPQPLLEVLHDRQAWLTLHVPKAARLGHPDNLRAIREIRHKYPGIILVIAHLGRCYTEAHALEALPQLSDDPGIYFDTSAVLNPASHRVALQCLGPQRIIYGSDNPVMLMRGRRQYVGRRYLNRTNYPFHFNQVREPPEIEAGYTLYLYEDLKAIKQACDELGLHERRHLEAIFHDNAERLIQSVLARKNRP